MEFTEKQQLFIDKVNDVIEKNEKKETFIVLQGSAGTGKTFTSAFAIKDCANKGLQVTVATPTMAAMTVSKNNFMRSTENEKDLRNKVSFSTIASIFQKAVKKIKIMEIEFTLEEDEINKLIGFLSNFLSPEQIDYCIVETKTTKTFYGNREIVKSYDVNVEILQEFLEPKLGKMKKGSVKQYTSFELSTPNEIKSFFNSIDVLFIDEMPMVSQDIIQLIKDSLSLFYSNEHFEKSKNGYQFKLINIVGDKDQLGPVEGLMNEFTMLTEDDDRMVVLSEILRSTDEIANLGKDLVNGKSLSGLKYKYEDIIEVDKGKTVDEIVKNNEKVFQDSDVVLTFTNKNVSLLNRQVRELKNHTDGDYVKNDRLMVMENTLDKAYINSQELIVTENIESKIAINLFDFFLGKIDRSQIGNSDLILKSIHFKSIDNTEKNDGEIVSILKESCELIKILLEKEELVLLKVKQNNSKEESLILVKQFESKDINGMLETNVENAMKNVNDMYPFLSYVKLTLGFARTIHKAQGSEWENVVVVLSNKDLFIGDSDRLLLTAVTRAKNKLKVFLI